MKKAGDSSSVGGNQMEESIWRPSNRTAFYPNATTGSAGALPLHHHHDPRHHYNYALNNSINYTGRRGQGSSRPSRRDRRRKTTQTNAIAGEENDDDDDISLDGAFWNEEIHRAFVMAILNEGIKQASPTVIIDGMECNDVNVTKDRVKSHLQKCRMNKEKATKEYMKEYDKCLRRSILAGAPSALQQPNTVGSGDTPLGGELAALLAYATMESDRIRNKTDLLGEGLEAPVMTLEEAQSPLGISIDHVAKLIKNVSKHMKKKEDGRFKSRTNEDVSMDNADEHWSCPARSLSPLGRPPLLDREELSYSHEQHPSSMGNETFSPEQLSPLPLTHSPTATRRPRSAPPSPPAQPSASQTSIGACFAPPAPFPSRSVGNDHTPWSYQPEAKSCDEPMYGNGDRHDYSMHTNNNNTHCTLGDRGECQYHSSGH